MIGDGKTAIVTGGSSGIGRATCIALAMHGYAVTVLGTSLDRINETIKLMSQATDGNSSAYLGLALNVTCEIDMLTMVSKTMEQFGTIDLLVASAGMGRRSDNTRLVPYPTASLPLAEWLQILQVNLTGVFLSNRAVLPTMISQGYGHIINICSASTRHGLRGEPYAPAYCASKFGVVGLTESLAAEVGSHGVRVQALFPGLVKTPMTVHTSLIHRYGGIMSADDVALTILYMVQQAQDCTLIHPHLIPQLQAHHAVDSE
ncbi:oxidoreductase [Neosynechococcus sphagnicola sy1]|uniref:Oxidoreductase n=1 Tax=Neosynechococcus sphagnicola sy1 TaxID=1497020 RepID=A0A098TMW5_9CYAN|nr:SDR family oxidoreductase [Neosynechococcus sphagnicola]KGF73634.1 oxidoreductase [Neosynechococcus sphagnicola sy1]